MSSIPRKQFWPYDEVSLSRDTQHPARFTINAPWLKLNIDVNAEDVPQLEQIAERLRTGNVGPETVEGVNWIFTSLASYPFSYILPRQEITGMDHHQVQSEALDQHSPQTLINSLSKHSELHPTVRAFGQRLIGGNWTWDADTALAFSQTPQGYDPETLFTIARRFHLLNDLENNKTGDLFQFVSRLKEDASQFRQATALIVRQNHYITEKCETVLRAALPIAKQASDSVVEFIRAEAGHDKILKSALRSLGADPSDIPAIDAAVVLMEIFQLIARRNLLAFAMVVDIFERTSYESEDPFTKLLNTGGEQTAGRQIDHHRQINDEGEHENVALGFLSEMAAVDEAYAREALQLAELLTLVIHQLSAETLRHLKAG